MLTTAELLGNPANGLVREVRQSQLSMAAAVEEVIANGGVYAVEGPVGIGKSFAYLLPSMQAAGKRIIIATAKKSLQDQLEAKDIPTLARTLGVVDGQAHPLTMNAAGMQFYMSRIIKGKSNYACRALADKIGYDATFRNWLNTSRYGDLASFPGQPPKWWPAATAEECVGRACKSYHSCGYTKLKLEIPQTRIVVINHHLLGSDMYYGFGKLLGGDYDVLIVDEAHKLSEGIRAAFTLSVSENTIVDLAQQLATTSFIIAQPQQLIPAWAQMFAGLPDRHKHEAHARTPPVFPGYADECMDGLKRIDDELARILRGFNIEGHPSEQEFWESFATAMEQFQGDDGVRNDLMLVAMSRRKIDGIDTGIHLMQGRACAQHEDEDENAWELRNRRMLDNTVIYAYSDQKGRFHVEAAPIHVGSIARNYLSQVKSTVITSATLAVDGKFDHLNDVIGVPRKREEILPTSFNYAKQGLAFIPKDTPVVGRLEPEYGLIMRRRIEYCEELIKLSQGGAFILTTANDELDIITEALKERLPYPVFAQSHSRTAHDGTPNAILQMYRQTPNAVLVGSKSFWEGVDIQGEQLRLVILSKLPFPSPQDPIVQARMSRYKKCEPCGHSLVGAYRECPGCGGELVQDGKRAWRCVAYVDMMIELRQGVGRLIRSIYDVGAVALLDSRALDPMPRVGQPTWKNAPAGTRYGKDVRQALLLPVTSDMNKCRIAIPKIVEHYRRLRETPAKGLACVNA